MNRERINRIIFRFTVTHLISRSNPKSRFPILKNRPTSTPIHRPFHQGRPQLLHDNGEREGRKEGMSEGTEGPFLALSPFQPKFLSRLLSLSPVSYTVFRLLGSDVLLDF